MDTLSSTNRQKLEAALQLLKEETTTFNKFENIRTLLKGINPTIDKTLSSCLSAIAKLKQIQEGEVIDLAVESLPEETEKQKKRKRTLLLFLSTWKNLRSEVERVKGLYKTQQSDGKITAQEHASTLAKVFAFAKGPFGLATIAALIIAGALIYLDRTAVTITIKNHGCATLTPIVKLPVSIPGLRLPTTNIADGNQGVATVPPLTVTVDGTQKGIIRLTALKFTMEYQLPGPNTDVIFNNQSLVGKRTVINLADSKNHKAIVRCSIRVQTGTRN